MFFHEMVAFWVFELSLVSSFKILCTEIIITKALFFLDQNDRYHVAHFLKRVVQTATLLFSVEFVVAFLVCVMLSQLMVNYICLEY